ncbi:MAG TPA: DUF2851 family protein [Cyclobacteriaceae bacterium]|jgi:hypothetical protein|nr:DUF2851 family protein [Cyclobacteriaceae bacterium]
MNESFLHYLWQFQYFDKKDLCSADGEPISILKAGQLNSNSGPDFSDAKIRINGMEWAGTVEIHVKSSDWQAHQHQTDMAYENVVLHVVWENDRPIFRKDNTPIPTLELKDRVEPSLIKEYKKLINSSGVIACEKSFAQVDDLVKLSMLERALMQRLEDKANRVKELLNLNHGDWEETCYQLLAKNFGFKVNSDPFYQLARSLPYKIIQKQNSQLQVEALLFGQAGMLETKTKDEYITSIFQEYKLLSQKYKLSESRLNTAQWRFLRLRPANFPTVRLAQFASLLCTSKNIFSQLISATSFSSVQKLLSVDQSSYWINHYRFGKKAKGSVPSMGESSIQNIIINTVAPLLVAYGKYKDEQLYIDKAVELLQQLPAEQNKITRTWDSLGLKIKTAFDSQSLIELYNNFCQKRQCLNCSVGVSILKSKS